MFNHITNVAKVTFYIASQRWIILLLVGLSLSLPFYQAWVYKLPISGAMVMYALISLVSIPLGYLLAYLFIQIINKMAHHFNIKDTEAKDNNTKDTDAIFSLFILAFLGLFLILYIDSFQLPDWLLYQSLFNHGLIMVGLYYGIGNCCFHQTLKPYFLIKNSLNIEKPTISHLIYAVTINLVIGMFMAILHFKASTNLKAELYQLSINEIKTSTQIPQALGQDYQFSNMIKGEIGSQYGYLRYNLVGNDTLVMVEARGQLVDNNWQVTDLTLSSPSKSIHIIGEIKSDFTINKHGTSG